MSAMPIVPGKSYRVRCRACAIDAIVFAPHPCVALSYLLLMLEARL